MTARTPAPRATAPATWLAVDGGNSKTDLVFGTADGHVAGYFRGPTVSPHVVGLDGTVRGLGALIAAAGLGPVDVAAFSLAGADLPAEVDQLHAALGAQGWGRKTIVDNDCFALLRAGTASPDAVAVVCGAGTNCVGRRADGQTARFLALGPISGDWGGGHDLADHTLRLAARGEDGRDAPTALSAAVAAHFGRATVEEVSIGLHLGDIPADRLFSLPPVLFATATAGDEAALSLVRRQADEILAQHRVAAGRLGLLSRPHALVLGGGVLHARHPVLHDLIVAGAVAQAPAVEITVLDTPPVVGAALLAVDALGGDPSAEPSVRTQLAAAGPTPVTTAGSLPPS
ncbi:N-acetylglucosamine kinase [Symbioplanes lichenis]|uniref:N-acetylglucosamine kinase n=1 Tax=Symbioplanes lichenis TaxID=1629072 RepID=UPI002738E4BA|nr:BadF/BadG/BcrA/BcrD ATPase family protein [Actinoplanes lichenis]